MCRQLQLLAGFMSHGFLLEMNKESVKGLDKAQWRLKICDEVYHCMCACIKCRVGITSFASCTGWRINILK